MAEFPTFKKPPIDEVAVGVVHTPTSSVHPVHLGLFWEEIKRDYPTVEAQAPICAPLEQFDTPRIAATGFPTIMFGPGADHTRYWLLSSDRTWMLQWQRDRLILNWRKTGGAGYPGFRNVVMPRFMDLWNRYLQFLDRQNFPRPVVLQCELDYIDLIDRGDGWENYADLGRIIAPWSGAWDTCGHLPAPEDVAVHASFRIPDRQGRVRVSVNPAIRQADGKEVVQLAIAARLRPMADDERNDVGAALDLLHEWAVNVFFGITTDGIRGHWGSNVI